MFRSCEAKSPVEYISKQVKVWCQFVMAQSGGDDRAIRKSTAISDGQVM